MRRYRFVHVLALACLTLVCLTLVYLTLPPALAVDLNRDVSPVAIRAFLDPGQVFHGGAPALNKASRDTVYLLGGPDRTDGNFESGWNGWTSIDFTADPEGVGDYAALYTNLQDVDACAGNVTQQVAFVDDGIVVPGTGGTSCITWCYGPGGYLVNNSGGLLGPDHHIRNGVVTPAIDLPADLDGLDVAFDVYDAVHNFTANDAGIFHSWKVRSTSDEDPADLEQAVWRDRGVFYLGRNVYERGGGFAADLLVDGARWMQLCLEVAEWGYLWDLNGADGHPAPYFDNVAVRAYDFGGPFISTRAVDLAQDTFPELSELDYEDLVLDWCRFDMARNISAVSHLRNDPGDSLVVQVMPRSGGALVGIPRMIVSLKANPLFDGVRTLPPGFSFTPDQKIKGTITGWLSDPDNGVYAFDLPDTGFIYPGDEVHYFFEAVDVRGGEQGLTRLPADTTGFDRFTGNQAVHTIFPPEFIMRALPTMFSTVPGDQPSVLFWDDGGDHDEYLRWRWSLADNGYNEGDHYDLYRTQGPGSGVGNGLGGRATSLQLTHYDILLYTCIDHTAFTLASGDYADDPSLDIQVLSGWFDRGDKSAFMVGDNLLSTILDQGATGSAFVNQYLGLDLVDRSLRNLISNQTAPEVVTLPGNGVLATVERWVTYGGCPRLADFDAVVPMSGAARLAEFTDPNGNDGIYDYGAASIFENAGAGSQVVTMPHGFAAIRNAPGWVPPAWAPARARSLMLRDILNYFGNSVFSPIAAPDAVGGLTASAHPNPFNPRCTIALSLPRSGDTSVKVYDVRGALVRTLHEGVLEAGLHELSWAGEDDRGARSSSGVYFYEVRTAGERQLGKLTLVK